MVLRNYKDWKKLEALAKPSDWDEGFRDDALHLEAMGSLVPLSERAQEAGEGVTEGEVLDGVMALGKACNRMGERNRIIYCFERAELPERGFRGRFEGEQRRLLFP